MAQSKIDKIANEVIGLGIAIFIIGIVLGIGTYIQVQLEEGMGNNTIPSQFKLSTYAASFNTLVVMLIITALIMVVFGVVIPTIRKSGRGEEIEL